MQVSHPLRIPRIEISRHKHKQNSKARTQSSADGMYPQNAAHYQLHSATPHLQSRLSSLCSHAVFALSSFPLGRLLAILLPQRRNILLTLVLFGDQIL